MNMKKSVITLICVIATSAGCVNSFAHEKFNVPNDVVFQPATNSDQEKVKVVKEYVPIPMPGQAMPLAPSKHTTQKKAHKDPSKESAVQVANQKAMQYPELKDYINSIMTYQYMTGAMYVVYAAPGKITDLQLQAGEQIVSYAAGDTTRWLVDKTTSGSGPDQQQHLLIKPRESNLSTTLVVMTSKRTYHIMLKSTDSTFMAAVNWEYPNELVTEVSDPTTTEAATNSSDDVNINNVNTNYKLRSARGRTKDWQPDFVFNTDHQTYIHLPNAIAQGNLPALLVGSGKRNLAATVNYRLRGNYMIIDGIYPYLELVLGTKNDRNRSIVQIIRVMNS